MFFSWPARKEPKEAGQRGATKMRPLWDLPLHRQSVSKNVPIFEHLHLKYCKLFHGRHPKIGTFSGVGWRCARRGFLRGHAFSECHLKPPSLVTFLAAKKVTLPHCLRSQKGIGICIDSFADRHNRCLIFCTKSGK